MISSLSSGKIDKHEYLTGEEIWPTQQYRLVEVTECFYPPLVVENVGKTYKDY